MPRRATQRRHVAPALLLKPTGKTPTKPGGEELPPEMVARGVNRLGFLGLICAVTAPSAYLMEYYIQPERVLLSGDVPFPLIVAVGLLAVGLAVCIAAWSGRVPARTMLDVGLLFEVAGALAIALSEHSSPWPPDYPIRGISWICLWIAIFVVAVPNTFGKVALAAIASAVMAPFGFLITTVANSNPVPSTNQLLILLMPSFVAAGWAIPAARYLNRLGVQVSRAREMGSYRLVEMIGRGGMGEVWRAEHRLLARASAIKLIRPEVLRSEEPGRAETLLRRFEREARATAALRSPHTVALYDFGIADDGSFYYVMELLEGLDLESLVDRHGPLPPARVIHVLQQVAKSLAEAHESGLVHRDIKPKNIFLCRLGNEYDFAKVLDFGLVKAEAPSLETQTQLTREGTAAGTPAFMAPEAALGSSPVDSRVDIYGAGCVGYWLVTGQLVFERDSAMATALAHVQTPPTPPSQRTELEIPACVEDIILRCLEKDPTRRPQSGRELYHLLTGCDVGRPWDQEQAESWWRTHHPFVETERTAADRLSTRT